MPENHTKSNGLHIEAQTTTSSDVFGDLCRNANDKEKCMQFVERLSEASQNIDRQDR